MIEVLELALVVIGIAGCFLPGVPGIPLVFAGVLVQEFFDPKTHYPWWLLLFMGLATLIIAVAQYTIPIWSTKQFGASKAAVNGAIIGLIIGAFTSFLGPFGLLIGPFAGAVTAELVITKKPLNESLKAGLGAFLGILTSTAVELIGSLVIAAVFFWKFFA